MTTPTTTAMITMAQQLTTTEDQAANPKQAIAAALAEMKKAMADEAAGTKAAFMAALTLGANAKVVRELLPEGTSFEEWVEKSFKGRLTIQWARKCINAALAFAALPKKASERNAILDKFGTIKGLASIRADLENGDHEQLLLTADAIEKPKRGAPTKTVRAARQAAAPAAASPKDSAQGDADVAAREAEVTKREAALDRREKVLDAKEARLNAQEEDLTQREQVLAMKLAALGKPGEVVDVTAKAPDDSNGLDTARAKAKKAPASPSSVAQTGGKRKVSTSTKGKPENAPNPDLSERAAETVAAIDATEDAAARPAQGDAPLTDAATEEVL